MLGLIKNTQTRGQLYSDTFPYKIRVSNSLTKLLNMAMRYFLNDLSFLQHNRLDRLTDNGQIGTGDL